VRDLAVTVAKNYRRGLTRVYLLLAIGWIAWGIYKPLYDRQKSIDYFYALGNETFHECEEANAPKQKQYDSDFQYWQRHSDAFEPLQPFLEDCTKTQWIYINSAASYQRETRADTYWRVGYLKMAAFCIIPPIAGYLAILGGIQIMRWVIRGFG